MKKSECIRHIIAEATARCAHKNVSDLRIAAEAAAALAETWWSIDWDPEEPELPRAIHASLYGPGITVLVNSSNGRTLTDEEYVEAAHRYNAYPWLEALAREMSRELANRCLRADLQMRFHELSSTPKESDHAD